MDILSIFLVIGCKSTSCVRHESAVCTLYHCLRFFHLSPRALFSHVFTQLDLFDTKHCIACTFGANKESMGINMGIIWNSIEVLFYSRHMVYFFALVLATPCSKYKCKSLSKKQQTYIVTYW